MSITRYFTNLTLAIAAGFVVIADLTFAATAGAWITFGIACGAALLFAGLLALRGSIAERSLAGLGIVLSAWMIVESLVFATGVAVTIGWACALGLIALAVAGLTVHELTTERVVHSLELHEDRTERESIHA
jgi:hypothetical protein